MRKDIFFLDCYYSEKGYVLSTISIVTSEGLNNLHSSLSWEAFVHEPDEEELDVFIDGMNLGGL